MLRAMKHQMASSETGGSQPITIKKYANRRLYNTATSSYVTLDHLCQMVKQDTEFVVYDAKTGEDITRSVLTQIIVEEENKGQHLLPISFLRQLISLYGDNLQWMVPNYLDYSMKAFARNQDQIRQYFQETMSGMFKLGGLEEVSKQNMAMFERAMKMFSPFPNLEEPAKTKDGEQPVPCAAESQQMLEALQRRLDELQRQLEALGQAAGVSGDQKK
jgi:polyhydroxyalkanoate synthesis repressor PhaR